MFPLPRTGSTWATPKSTPCASTATGAAMALRRPRSTSPRKTSSSTNGATTTALTTSDTT